jgi:hypothetical protein
MLHVLETTELDEMDVLIDMVSMMRLVGNDV